MPRKMSSAVLRMKDNPGKSNSREGRRMSGWMQLTVLRWHAHQVKNVTPLVIIEFTNPAFLFLVDCKWSEWDAWGSCSQPCESGTRQRSRTYAQMALHGGSNCTGAATDTQFCYTGPCEGNQLNWTWHPFFFPPCNYQIEKKIISMNLGSPL